MTSIAKLFMSGRSQAIRLPAKLRFQSKQVRIEQVGNALWVTPDVEKEHNLGQWLSTFYQQTDPLPENFLQDRDDSPAQERDWT
ncbi:MULTISPECIES: antitoxin [unclassified Polynucleobacter]|jgi:antitoxin VapB|uniref:antitoxin n=1 Tax=unclassified Polynucleobacter TaxID=2640945 RepID=UPI001BFEAA24|nr:MULTISPECIES: AbrB/MazE/SpoVT family DNA-binding domain-containing protein [unclassified Polynucleobacter]MBU3547832.1 AbrB family transcriptional regulator [Polynucleobacter sp. P1-05-14]MBU3638517.1 AbrB family transcriptional regulator [Polynucleobacter sp. AP-RePozz3-80-G7]QWD81909.1 AbrB family transcriptional regulator [Polynucleobacter sp. MWH-S4W17]